jgi:hypothetical protein
MFKKLFENVLSGFIQDFQNCNMMLVTTVKEKVYKIGGEKCTKYFMQIEAGEKCTK